MMKSIGSVLLAGLALSAVTSDAMAQKRHHAKTQIVAAASDIDTGSSPLTVNRRSWLDPGNAVRTTDGGGPSYIAANTINNKTQDRIFAPDGFGNDVIKGQPYVPGESQPVVEGSSLPNGGVAVDNVLLPQNFYLNPAPSVP